MSKVILFPHESGVVAVMSPTGELSTQATANKDVPDGVPFIIVDAADLPAVSQSAWVVDFSEPDGFGGTV